LGNTEPDIVGFSTDLFRAIPPSVLACFPTVIHLFSRLLFPRELGHAWLIAGAEVRRGAGTWEKSRKSIKQTIGIENCPA
jgi:hypothetical protein